MTSSIDWTKTAGELATMAGQRVQMLGDGQTLTGHRFTVWKDHINDFLKLLQTQGPTEWREAEQTVTLVAGQAAYTLNPRPYRVPSTGVRYRDAGGRDMPIARWNRGQYDNIPYKDTQGIPACHIIRRSALTAMQVVLWPVPNTYVATGSLKVSYDRVIEDVVDANSVIDLPQEWLGMAADITGVRLASSFRLDNPAVKKADERGSAALNELLGADHDDSITFVTED